MLCLMLALGSWCEGPLQALDAFDAHMDAACRRACTEVLLEAAQCGLEQQLLVATSQVGGGAGQQAPSAGALLWCTGQGCLWILVAVQGVGSSGVVALLACALLLTGDHLGRVYSPQDEHRAVPLTPACLCSAPSGPGGSGGGAGQLGAGPGQAAARGICARRPCGPCGPCGPCMRAGHS